MSITSIPLKGQMRMPKWFYGNFILTLLIGIINILQLKWLYLNFERGFI